MNMPENVQRLVDSILGTMRGLLAEGIELQPFVFLGQIGKSCTPFKMDMSSPSAKDFSAAAVKKSCSGD